LVKHLIFTLSFFPVYLLLAQGVIDVSEPLPSSKEVVITDSQTTLQDAKKKLNHEGTETSIQKPSKKNNVLPLTNEVHAESIAPVLHADKPIYIRTFSQLSFRHDQMNTIIQEGMIYINFHSPFKRDLMPKLKMRPIDGGLTVPFLIRTHFTSRKPQVESGFFIISLDLPVIFSPMVTVSSASLGDETLSYKISRGPDPGHFAVCIPLGPVDVSQIKEPLFVAGTLSFDDYTVIAQEQFKDLKELSSDKTLHQILHAIHPSVKNAADEKQRLLKTAQQIKISGASSYDVVRGVNRFVGRRLHFFSNEMTRTPIEILAEKLGDGEDYTRVTAALLRTLDIPCNVVHGTLYDFLWMTPHSWVEVGLPLKNDMIHWFINDPMRAAMSENGERFVQIKDRDYIYSVCINSNSLKMNVDSDTEIILNSPVVGDGSIGNSTDFQTVFQKILDVFGRSVTETEHALTSAGISLEREFKFSAGSNYLFLSRPPEMDLAPLSKITDPDFDMRIYSPMSSVHSLWQVKVSPWDDLIFEIGVTNDNFNLNRIEDRQTIRLLKQATASIRNDLFNGRDLRHLLEFKYHRHKYTDRLQKVTLRVSRYLAHHYCWEIADICRNVGLLSDTEFYKIIRFHQITGGRNMYYLLEHMRYERARKNQSN